SAQGCSPLTTLNQNFVQKGILECRQALNQPRIAVHFYPDAKLIPLQAISISVMLVYRRDLWITRRYCYKIWTVTMAQNFFSVISNNKTKSVR
ncbi:MAG TPA: hypothetical protein DCM42_00520, partial [Brucella melitensis]|nr:hypothetical protein [Brucella melitensis]